VTRIDRGSPAVLETPAGELTADRVALATNIWAGAMPEFRRTVIAISSDVIATEPIPDRLAGMGWSGHACVSDSQMMIHYYRTSADGRIVFGKGGWGIALGGRIPPSFDRSRSRAAAVEENFRRIFPALDDVRITHDWSGGIDRSAIGLPIIGHTGGRDHIVHAVGWSANAVGPSRVGGKFLASMLLEQDDAWSRSALVDLPPRRFPPEPLRYLGAHLVRTGVVVKERAELDGRTPGRVVSFLAHQVPAGLIAEK
jgi:glycine/D-amino acid oxidase-like deaminating enzyme